MSEKKWEGVWDSDFGKLHIYENNKTIYGDYHDNGFIIGALSRDSNGRHFMTGKFTNGDREGSFKFYVVHLNFDIITGSTDQINTSLEGYWTWDFNVTSNTTWSEWPGVLAKDEQPRRLQSLAHITAQAKDITGSPVRDYRVKLTYKNFIYQDYRNSGAMLDCYVTPNHTQITLSKSGYKDVVKNINMVQPSVADVISIELEIIFELV